MSERDPVALAAELERTRDELRAAVAQLPRLRQLVEFSADVMLLLDGRLVVVDCNREAARELGYPRDGLYGLGLAELVVDAEPLAEALSVPTEQLLTAELRRRDGSTFPAEVKLTVYTHRGERFGVAMARDVTERRRMAAQVAHTQRLSAVGTLAAGVAHEINNPVAYAHLNLTFAMDRLRDHARVDPEVEAALRDALHGLERVRDIVRDLAKLSRSVDRTQVTDVHDALRSAVEMTANDLRHRARLVMDVPALPLVVGDQAHVSQVFLNLLVNAAQAIQPGQAGDHVIEVRAEVVDDLVVVELQDSGRGIAPEHLERVFEPFFTTKPIGEGTGLGLSVSRETVLGLGGALDISSIAGVGTTVRVSLPVAGAPVVSREASTQEPPAVRLLVIDDEPRVGLALVRMLRGSCDVVAVLSGQQAFELLENGETFDVVLCDVMMPDCDGEAVHAWIRRNAPELEPRVGFMTGGVFTRDSADFVDAMGDRVLTKPFGRADLAALIARLV